MAYLPETLSEQIAISGLIGVSIAGTTTLTGAAIDAREHHRLRFKALAFDYSTNTTKGSKATTKASTSATVTLKVQASTSTGFATPTTLGTTTISAASTSTVTNGATGTATAKATALSSASLSYTGEQIQAQRAAEDRYVRCIVVVKAGVGIAWAELDTDRYKG